MTRRTTLTLTAKAPLSLAVARVLDRSDLAEHEAGCRIDLAFDAGAVVSLDALEIELDELLGK